MINPIFDWLLENVEVNKLCWYSLSINPNITWDLVKKYDKKPWNWYLLAKHPNISWSIIKNNYNQYWNNNMWVNISENPNITWDIIINNYNFMWSWKELSCHPNITFEIIKNNLNCSWSWKLISYNPNITWKNILDNPNHKWYYETLIYNKNIYWDIINNNQKIISFLKTKFYNIDYLFDKLDWLLISSDKRLNYDTINYINKVCYVTKNQQNNNPNKTNEEIISSFWYKQQLLINLEPSEIFKLYNLDNLDDLNYMDHFLLNKNINLEQLLYIINNDKSHSIGAGRANISFEVSQNALLDIHFFNNNREFFCDLGFMINPNIDLTYIKSLTDTPEGTNYIHWICGNKLYYDNYYISNDYKKLLVKEFNDKCLENLIQKACHPSRLFNWNEDVSNYYQDEYINECNKYK